VIGKKERMEYLVIKMVPYKYSGLLCQFYFTISNIKIRKFTRTGTYVLRISKTGPLSAQDQKPTPNQIVM